MRLNFHSLRSPRPAPSAGFTVTDLLVTLAIGSLLAAVLVPAGWHVREKSRLAQCLANLGKINQAMLEYAHAHEHTLPRVSAVPAPGGWWTYTELVKKHLGLAEMPGTPAKVFACPSDRGYGEGAEKPQPFCQSKKYNFTSYVFNGVTLPGVPNISGRRLASIREPARTLLMMEWSAHAPLSWHRSRTGGANTPFYNDAENVVGFVDGHAAFIKIYYDGLNAAYTRDPAPGYQYKFSGD